jgi:D-arabinose 1-dehydrogenase-like Zn-dependent alcohol dehydrogenase
LVEGLAPNAKLLVPAEPDEPLTIKMAPMIAGRRSLAGCYAGTAKDSQDTLEFSQVAGVHPNSSVSQRFLIVTDLKDSSQVALRQAGTHEAAPGTTKDR